MNAKMKNNRTKLRLFSAELAKAYKFGVLEIRILRGASYSHGNLQFDGNMLMLIRLGDKAIEAMQKIDGSFDKEMDYLFGKLAKEANEKTGLHSGNLEVYPFWQGRVQNTNVGENRAKLHLLAGEDHLSFLPKHNLINCVVAESRRKREESFWANMQKWRKFSNEQAKFKRIDLGEKE